MRKRGGDYRHSGVDFGSNDYLGLRRHPAVLSCLADVDALGSGASPVLSGYTPDHRALENQIAQFSRLESALVFSSGFACNVGSVACLAGPDDAILSDELNHASLIDGCRLSRATTHVYPHNDVEHLVHFLRSNRHRYEKVLVITESVFSMDGDLARLAELVELCRSYDCGLIVDEAHATGIYGRLGSGLVEELGLESHVLVKLGTFSKAIGSIGGYACGSNELVEYLVNHCRSYMFSTAPPVAIMRATAVAIGLISSMTSERSQLRATSRELRNRLRSNGWDVADGDSPIVPVIVGSQVDALELARSTMLQGVNVPAIRPPTVAAGKCRLRISLKSTHSPEEIDRLVNALGQRTS